MANLSTDYRLLSCEHKPALPSALVRLVAPRDLPPCPFLARFACSRLAYMHLPRSLYPLNRNASAQGKLFSHTFISGRGHLAPFWNICTLSPQDADGVSNRHVVSTCGKQCLRTTNHLLVSIGKHSLPPLSASLLASLPPDLALCAIPHFVAIGPAYMHLPHALHSLNGNASLHG